MFTHSSNETVTQVEHMKHEDKINDIHANMNELHSDISQLNKWRRYAVSSFSAEDIEFLEFHYHKLVHKYDAEFDDLETIKNICIANWDEKNNKEERDELLKKLNKNSNGQKELLKLIEEQTEKLKGEKENDSKRS